MKKYGDDTKILITDTKSKEELQAWLAKRKKCCVIKSKNDYTRKEKHKNAESYD